MNTIVRDQLIAQFATITSGERIDAASWATDARVLATFVRIEVMGEENEYVLLACVRNRYIDINGLLEARHSEHVSVATYAHDRSMRSGALVAA